MADEKTHTVVDDSTTKPVMSNNNLEKTKAIGKKRGGGTVITTHVRSSFVTTDAVATPILNTAFVLEGIRYDAIKLLSESSGEAQVYLVENEGKRYVLKLYYPSFSPKENILRIIWNFDFEFIIKMYEYGKTFLNGSSRDYELMEYLEGGTFNEYRLNGDFEKFRRIVLSCAGALAYCHNNNIIHKDIKPSNFFFRDINRTEVVLGDFGISSLCDDEELFHKTTQARTPVYAAPEMYENVIDREVEITNKIDFYSLGITLLYLWLGKNPFSNNERAMMRMKSEGKLPNLDKLPEPVNRLIRGLTVVNPEKRWGYDEVERWYKGEEVQVDESSVYLRYKSFIVDPETNLVADDAKELASLLYDNKALGIKYLYSKRISKWLEECGNPKLATEIDDIVEKRYPINQDAGFLAAVFTLDKSFPYYDIKGIACTDVHELAITLWEHKKEYGLLLQDPCDPLFIYLESVTDKNINRIRSYFKAGDPEIAIWKLIYEIDGDVPFLADKPSSTISEIVNAFASENCSEDEWKSIVDGRLLSWMYNKGDAALCEEIRILTENKLYSKVLAYNVLYHLDRSIGYDLKFATSKELIAEIMNRDLQAAQSLNEEDFKKFMSDYIDDKGRLFQYAKLHGWNDVLHFKEYCFDLKSKENRERCGVYDWHTAAYKFCAGLGFVPGYHVRDLDEVIYSLEALDALNARSIKTELREGSLKQWLTLFFHEDPFEHFKEEYSYEKTLESYLLKLGKYDSSDVHYRRFLMAKEQVKEKLAESERYFKDAHHREDIWRTGYMVFTVILFVSLLFFGISNKALFVSSAAYAVGVPVGLATMVMAGVWGYFTGNGVTFILLSGAVGAATAAIPVTCIKWVGHHYPGALLITCMLFVLIYFLIGYLLGMKKSRATIKDLKGLFKEDINTSLLEPLNYTFKTKAEKFKASNFGVLDDAINVVKATNSEVIIHYMLWTFFMALLVFEFVCFHPKLMDLKVPNVTTWKINWGDDVEQWKEVE